MTEYERDLHRIASARGQFESVMRLSHPMRGNLTGQLKFMYEHRLEVLERLDLAEKAIREGGLEGADAVRLEQLKRNLAYTGAQ